MGIKHFMCLIRSGARDRGSRAHYVPHGGDRHTVEKFRMCRIFHILTLWVDTSLTNGHGRSKMPSGAANRDFAGGRVPSKARRVRIGPEAAGVTLFERLGIGAKVYQFLWPLEAGSRRDRPGRPELLSALVRRSVLAPE